MPFGWNETELLFCRRASYQVLEHIFLTLFLSPMHVNHISCYEFCCSCCCCFLLASASILNWVQERESHAEQLHCTRLPHKEYDYYSCTNLLIKCLSYIHTHTYKSLKRYGISSYFRLALLKIIMFVFWQRNVPIIAHKIDAHTQIVHILKSFPTDLMIHSRSPSLLFFILCSFAHSLLRDGVGGIGESMGSWLRL